MIGRRLHRGGLAGHRLVLVRKRRARKIQHGCLLSDAIAFQPPYCRVVPAPSTRRARGSDPRNEVGLSNAITSLTQPRSCLEHIRILGDELLPQFTHHPLNILPLVMIAVGTLVTTLTQADNARMRIAGMGNDE
jgi:hypothetical protein